MKFSTFSSLAALVLPSLVAAQLTGTVGPTTTRASKRATVCNVLDYGGVASKTSDVGPAIASAFAACKSGGTVYVPPGDYGMSTWVSLSGGTAWAFQLDGIIYRTGTDDGNMIFIEHTTDFEMYSSTSAGAIQGYGYTFHTDGTYGPRLLRLYKATSWSVHDIALVDSPAFHFCIDTCDSGEVYNMIIRGGNEGGLDGIDVWGTNIHIHDVEVTNKDECVTVKSPASGMLIENIYCNWSGGCALGSLGLDTNISNIIYSNIYTQESNQMLMIKSNGGSGTVTNCQFNNFIGHSNAYSLDIDSYWSSISAGTGDGVELTDITFDNWKGDCENGANRGPIKVLCPSGVPCTGIDITDFAMWTESGSKLVNVCGNAYGSGGCIATGTANTAYTTTQTVTSTPTSYSAATMADDLTAGFGLTASIPIPTIPTSFFPGATPASALLGSGSTSSAAAVAVVKASASSATTSAAISSSTSNVSPVEASSSATVSTATVVPVKTSSSSIISSAAIQSTSSAPEATTTSDASPAKSSTPSSAPASVSSSSFAFPSGFPGQGGQGFGQGGRGHSAAVDNSDSEYEE